MDPIFWELYFFDVHPEDVSALSPIHNIKATKSIPGRPK